MTLSDRSLGWLRHLDRTPAATGTADPADARAVALALGLQAQRTPAWTERHLALLDRLLAAPAAAADGGPQATATRLVLRGIRSMLDPGEDTPAADDDLALRIAGTWPAGTGAGGPPDHLVWAGLGLLLHDRRHGTDLHTHTFLPWWETAGRAALAGTGDLAGRVALAVAAAPQLPDEARAGFAATIADRSVDDVVAAGARTAGFALLLAKEWGLTDLAGALTSAADARFGTVADTERAEFHWGTGSGAVPGGVVGDAALAGADAGGPGRLAALCERPLPLLGRLVDVDFPAVALRRAEWTRDCLVLRIDVPHPEPARTASFRLVDTEPRIWCMTGIDRVTTEITGHGVIVRIPQASGELEFTPGSY